MITALQKKSLIYARNYSAFIVVTWSLYRVFYGTLPEDFEEIILKPLIWIGPIFYLLSLEGKGFKSLGYHFKNLFNCIYFILALGAGFALLGLIVNVIKYSGPSFSARFGDYGFITSFFLSTITAVTEETVFRGYLFTRFWKGLGNEFRAALATTFVWTLVHVPIVLTLGLTYPLGIALYLVLIALYGFGACFVYARTRNIASSILLHLLWEWPILLFR